MIFLIPDKLIGKVEYCYKDIKVVDGIILIKEEQELFEKTREKLHLAEKRRLGSNVIKF